MSEETPQAQKEMALGQYVCLKQHREEARKEIQKLAAQMRQLSNEISIISAEKLSETNLDPIPWINPEPIRALARDLESAESAFDAGRQRLIKLKITIPF